MVDWGFPRFYVRKGVPSTGNFYNIGARERNEYFPLAEKLKLKGQMKIRQLKPVTMVVAGEWGEEGSGRHITRYRTEPWLYCVQAVTNSSV